MIITLVNFLKDHTSKIKAAKKLAVRDLDSIDKFTTVAYVDDVGQSNDVQIIFDAKKSIKNTM